MKEKKQSQAQIEITKDEKDKDPFRKKHKITKYGEQNKKPHKQSKNKKNLVDQLTKTSEAIEAYIRKKKVRT